MPSVGDSLFVCPHRVDSQKDQPAHFRRHPVGSSSLFQLVRNRNHSNKIVSWFSVGVRSRSSSTEAEYKKRVYLLGTPFFLYAEGGTRTPTGLTPTGT